MMRADEMMWDMAWPAFLFSFIYGFSCWCIHSFLLAHRKELGGESRLYPALCVLGVALLIFIFDWIFGFSPYADLQFSESTGIRKYFSMAFRGLMLNGFYYFIVYHLHIQNQKQQHLLEIEQLKQAKLEANLSSLREQLSPHFLFNTFSTLSSISQEEEVKEYIEQLANVYRYLLKHSKMDTVTWQQELSFMTSYLYIIKTRMEEAIDVQVRIGPERMQCIIPPLTLQILVENAIKHNIASISNPLQVVIADDEDGYLRVCNNFQPRMATKPSTGIGLENVQQRYGLLFGRSIEIFHSADAFTVKLPIVAP